MERSWLRTDTSARRRGTDWEVQKVVRAQYKSFASFEISEVSLRDSVWSGWLERYYKVSCRRRNRRNIHTEGVSCRHLVVTPDFGSPASQADMSSWHKPGSGSADRRRREGSLFPCALYALSRMAVHPLLRLRGRRWKRRDADGPARPRLFDLVHQVCTLQGRECLLLRSLGRLLLRAST